MSTHLHVHLEPNERKRALLGESERRFSNASEFFAQHDLANPQRVPVGLRDMCMFIQEFHREQGRQQVDYAEVRLSPRRFVSNGAALSTVLAVASGAVSTLSRPVVRLILLINRDSPDGFVEACHEIVDGGLLPVGFVGMDLAGDEVRFPDVRRFTRLFSAARSAGLGITVHAGEFGGEENIWQAIDLLGAMRIGHGVSARSPQILSRLREDGILLEMSVSSNLGLGAVASLEEHPLPKLVDYGVPVCLNTDVPWHLGTTLSEEYQLASRVLHGHEDALNMLELAAQRHAFSPTVMN
jgi:aminodeoxyfutalosine deaminase